MRLPSQASTGAAAVLLSAAVLVGFWPLLGNGFVNYDDEKYVTRNSHVQTGLTPSSIGWAWTTGDAANWHPLTWLSHMLDWELFGDNAAGHHGTSLLLHLANTLLLFVLLHRLTGATMASAAAAALFGVHPLHVESVAWIAERKDVLSTLFWLLATLAYVRCARTSGPWSCRLVVVFLALGLCSKPMLVTLPFTLLLLDYWPLARWPERGAWSLVREKIPLFALSVVSSGVTLAVQRAGEAVRTLEQFPLGVRASTAIVSCVVYLRKTIWPSDLAVFYPHPQESLPMTTVAGAALILVAISVLAVLQRRRRPYLLVGWLWYLGTLVPVIGLVQVGAQALADRYTYVPLIGIFVIVAWGVPDALRSLLPAFSRPSVPSPRAAWAAAGWGLTVGVLIIGARGQASHWRDSVALWERAIAVTSDNPLAHHNLGNALTEAGRTDEAIRHYRETLRLAPSTPLARTNLGRALARAGRMEEAIRQYERAVDLEPEDADAHNNLGIALAGGGRTEEAVDRYAEALRLRPGFAEAHNNLGVALTSMGRAREAIPHFDEALRLSPDYAEAHNNLGLALAREGRPEEAVEHYSAAVRHEPGYAKAHNNLGRALTDLGRTDDAIARFERAVELDPGYAEAHNNLGMAFGAKGRADDALRHYEAAVRARPDFPEALNNLGGALVAAGRVDEAVAAFDRALDLRPGYGTAHSNRATALYFKGDYEEAWKAVAQARRHGFDPPRRLLDLLSERMPEPR